MFRQQGLFAFVIALAILASAVCNNFPLELGLDLRGGSQLTLQVQTTDEIDRVKPEQLEAVKSVLDRRVNGLGVSESTLQTIGDDQLVLQLPGEQDPTRAAKVLGETALLEFRIQEEGSENDLKSLRALRSQVEKLIEAKDLNNQTKELDSLQLDLQKDQLSKAGKILGINSISSNESKQLDKLLDKLNEEIVKRFKVVGLTGKDLISAGRQQEQTGDGWEVTLSFNSEGGEKFAEITKSIAGTGRLLGIVLDGRSISEATVGPQFKVAGITGGAATISGNFTPTEAKDLEVQLRGGSLPLPIKTLQVRSISPSLGADNIKTSLIAALSGLALVAIFMLFAYRLAGLVAVIALSLYALFNISIYTLIPVTLTLPGVAGFILSIGMAVDANVLIFERVKDELRKGNTLIRSIDKGFSEAFSSIIDGHLTTLISCTALFFLGTGFVKGFAATLGIGVSLSLFTALGCTRTLLKFFMSYQSLRRVAYFLPTRKST